MLRQKGDSYSYLQTLTNIKRRLTVNFCEVDQYLLLSCVKVAVAADNLTAWREVWMADRRRYWWRGQLDRTPRWWSLEHSAGRGRERHNTGRRTTSSPARPATPPRWTSLYRRQSRRRPASTTMFRQPGQRSSSSSSSTSSQSVSSDCILEPLSVLTVWLAWFRFIQLMLS